MTAAPRTPDDSRCETTHIVLPGATNALGTLFGGTVMQWIDEVASVAATRHAAGPVVTAAVDALQFLAPVELGSIVVLKAQVNTVARTSMEVGVRVEVEDPTTGQRRRTTKAYLTFVAIELGKGPREVPPLRLVTDDDRRRDAEARARRAHRLEVRAARADA